MLFKEVIVVYNESCETHKQKVKICRLLKKMVDIVLSGRPLSSSGSVPATGPKIRGFKPGRGRWIFKGDKRPSEGK
jgi:hypothetical protein